jgi:hypothetical protein
MCRRAQRMVRTAVQEGRLEKSDHCLRCGTEDVIIVGHHSDYSKPLDVVWLCRPCHAREHGKSLYHLQLRTCAMCGRQMLGNRRRLYCSNRCKLAQIREAAKR